MATFKESKMIRLKSATHPSFRKMVLVDEDLLSNLSDRPTPSPPVPPAISTLESCTEAPAKIGEVARTASFTKEIATVPKVAKQPNAKRAKRKPMRPRPVARYLTPEPGHSPKVLRLY